MMTNTKVTRATAEKVLRAVRKQASAYIEPGVSEPVLLEGWDFLGTGAYRWSIVWEGGPYEWAIHFPYGDVDEELTALGEEFGLGVIRSKDVSADIPAHVYTEAITSWAIGIAEKG